MKKLAKFEKVSFDEFEKSCDRIDCQNFYDGLKLPRRATTGSAGYDFFVPFDIELQPHQIVTVPTGIRAFMPENWVLMIFPRSGLGFAYRLRLSNTVGIIDSDYVDSKNQGHIFLRLANEGSLPLSIKQGAGFAQGVFLQYGITEDDDASEIRDGGMGSTD